MVKIWHRRLFRLGLQSRVWSVGIFSLFLSHRPDGRRDVILALVDTIAERRATITCIVVVYTRRAATCHTDHDVGTVHGMEVSTSWCPGCSALYWRFWFSLRLCFWFGLRF